MGEIAVPLARGVADVATLSAFGAVLFLARIGVWPRGLRAAAFAWLWAAAGLALAWAAVEAQAMAGDIGALPDVLRGTLFGHVVLVRLGLLGLAALALWRRAAWWAAGLAGAAAASLAGHGHAFAMDEGFSWLLASETLHLLAAGAWLGQLLPLLAFVAVAGPADAALAARRFSRWGTACVLVMAGTALDQSSVLIGSLAGLIGTDYGRVALFKLALFLLLLAFAGWNRFRLTPALLAADGAAATRRLCRSIAGESVAGLMIVMAAGLLTSLEPAMHLMGD